MTPFQTWATDPQNYKWNTDAEAAFNAGVRYAKKEYQPLLQRAGDLASIAEDVLKNPKRAPLLEHALGSYDEEIIRLAQKEPIA